MSLEQSSVLLLHAGQPVKTDARELRRHDLLAGGGWPCQHPGLSSVPAGMLCAPPAPQREAGSCQRAHKVRRTTFQLSVYASSMACTCC